MKHLIFTAGIITATATLGHAQTVYDMSDFENIEVSRGIDLHVTPGDFQQVEAEAISGSLRRLKLYVDQDTLVVTSKKRWGIMSWFWGDQYKVTVTTRMLNEIDADSGSNVTLAKNIPGLTEIDTTSGAAVMVQNAEFHDVELNASSGSMIKVAGSCFIADTDASSGAQIDASGLTCDQVRAEASSGSNILISSAKLASLEATSGASIVFSGNAETFIEERSGGTVSRR